MKRQIATLFLLAGLALPAYSQVKTVVSGTVVDPNGVPYANGTVETLLIPTGGTPTVNGKLIDGHNPPAALDGNGHFSVSLFCNTAAGGCDAISPSATRWQFQITNPGAQPPVGFGPVSFTVTINVTGATQDVSAALNAAAPVLLRQTGGGGGGVSSVSGTPGQISVVNGTTTPVISIINPVGLNNASAYAPATTINDGSPHLVSAAPLSSPFNGKTTLAGIAAISLNGGTPFSWITGVPFTGATSVYGHGVGGGGLVDADVPNLDITWLAIQAALISGKAYLSAGTYIVGSVLPLPLFIPLSNQNAGNFTGTPFMMQGSGENITYVKAGSDFGLLTGTNTPGTPSLGIPLLACGDPAGTLANSLGRYAGGNGQCNGDVQDLTLRSSAGNVLFAAGTVPISMDGFAWGARLRTKDVSADGFNHDWTLVGDHTLFIRAHGFGGTNGMYWAPPSPSLAGDLQFEDLNISGQGIGSLVADPSATIGGTFSGETYLSAAYAIFGEAGAPCAALVNEANFERLMTEFVGNGYIVDDNNFSGGVYNDSNHCRAVQRLNIEKWYQTYSNGHFWGGGRGRRASIDVQFLGINIADLTMDNAQFVPTAGPSGPVPFTTINFNTIGSGGNYGIEITGQIALWIGQSGTLPLVSSYTASARLGAFYLEEPGIWKGTMGRWASVGNYTTTTAGDIFEINGNQLGPGGTNTTPINGFGVVMQSGLVSGNYVPLSVTGAVKVNVGWATAAAGPWKKSSGVGRAITITAGGSGGTDGTFSWTATGGGCLVEPTGTFTVTGGTIVSTTITTHGVGCTSGPTLSTSASGGLSGATLTPIWPSALAAQAATLHDKSIVGFSFFNSNPGGGANSITAWLNVQAGGGIDTFADVPGQSFVNNTSTGTVVNELAILTGAPSTATVATTGSTTGVIGLVVSGAGTTGNSRIFVTRGMVGACVFDATAVTAGDYVVASTTTGGTCHDAGSTRPASLQVIGIAQASGAASSTQNVLLTLDGE